MGRAYEATHPWLTYKLDLRSASPRLWVALGEAQSKCYHIGGVPLRPDIAEDMHKIYLARGLLATTAIEGNTLTEKEVRAIVDNESKLPSSREYLGKEIESVLAAFNSILKDVEMGQIKPLTPTLVQDYNTTVLRNLKLDTGIAPGKIRDYPVGVGLYRGAPFEDCEYLLQRLCNWLNSNDFEAPNKEDRVIYGLIKSIVAHVYLAWIHPFGDGNGRTARLLEAKFLLEAGVPSAAAHLLSNHYNLTRTEYYKQLENTSLSQGNLLPFIEYAVAGFVDQLREQIETIRIQQVLVSWVNYVHEKLSQKTPSGRRQLHVVLAMSDKSGYIKKSDIRQLTAQIAAEYATKTYKTLTRDLNRLKKLDLIESGIGGYQAKIATMLAFLPSSIDQKVPIAKPIGKPEESQTGQLTLGL